MPPTITDLDLQMVHRKLSGVLTELETCFKPGAKLTFIMRMPGMDECEMVVTDDTLDDLQRLIGRMKERENAAHPDR